MTFMVICLVGGLNLAISPAAGQSAESLDPAAVTRTIDPASIIDVAGFSERAAAWAAAQVDHRASAIERAEALAAETKAAEDAELERIEAEDSARRAAEEEARRHAEEHARQAAQAAITTTTTEPPADDGSAVTETKDASSAGEAAEDVVLADGPSADEWHALRQCESGNNYRVVSATGRYRGAYQFSVTTWDWLAGSRYPELVGVDPSAATDADQDKMARALYAVYGKSPWPVCGKYLP